MTQWGGTFVTESWHILLHTRRGLSMEEGEYHLIWQRSFPKPILSLDDVDITGDGLQEIIILTLSGLHILQVRLPSSCVFLYKYHIYNINLLVRFLEVHLLICNCWFSLANFGKPSTFLLVPVILKLSINKLCNTSGYVPIIQLNQLTHYTPIMLPVPVNLSQSLYNHTAI